MDVRKEETKREYDRRIQKAKRYIALHIGEDIALSEIAAEAAFSEYHFHRIFRSLTGETVARHIRRLRLEKAANRLQHADCSTVTAIGLECGFNNPTVFSRAFKEMFGVTPETYRKGRRSAMHPHGPRIKKPFRLRGLERVTVAEYPPERLLFFPHVGPYDKSLVSFYRRVDARTRSIRTAGGFHMIGIALDNPHITPRNLCRYELGVPVVESQGAPSEGEIRIFSPGLTAVYHFEGLPFMVDRTFDGMYFYWLTESGYLPAESPAFIVHRDNRFFAGFFMRTRIDICLPVKPL